ncbi:cell division protein FtsW [Agaricicola taiwanensis]|uniref:Probable peptidoglycan glycosyltransferase FtsW n=1 Tax=Agaricicola taiwanensis TaxID=591372 RepID=A0A8J2W3S1_9RHOB|nr:putative lipid II flippase FtsW [Agaricicola taiwanensis]GGE42326.1 cell division protein FtsW [Agaricicola taiwanensis]
MMSRAERTIAGEWWWTVDRWLLGALGLLTVAGIVLSLAASPAVAERLGLGLFHFVNRQVFFALIAIPVLLTISFLSPRQVRRVALLAFIVGWVMLVSTLFFGAEIKGSRRWISILGITVQPSELIKPAFVILCAWLFSEGARRRDVPGHLLAVLLLGLVVTPLILQPDFGQTLLVTTVWGALFFLAGLGWMWVVGLTGAGAVGFLTAYTFIPHVAERINRFLDPESGDTYQVDRAIESFVSGGWFGKGPGEGTVKRVLPDSHTDFVFAVTGEEFGIIACLALLSIFAFIVLRGLNRARREEDLFVRFAVAGLSMLFGLQALINMAVNVHLLPAKGMTLPFISSGGSSLVSLSFGMGLLIALTRDRPRAELVAEEMAAQAERSRR